MMKRFVQDIDELRIFRDGIEMYWNKEKELFVQKD